MQYGASDSGRAVGRTGVAGGAGTTDGAEATGGTGVADTGAARSSSTIDEFGVTASSTPGRVCWVR
jgi:hypothetical protein